MRRSAMTEALARFAGALELVVSLPDTRSRDSTKTEGKIVRGA